MVMTTKAETTSEVGTTTVARLQEQFLSEPWEAVRDRGLTPRVVSENHAGPTEREALFHGLKAMGHDPEQTTVHPQQLQIVECLASGRRHSTIIVPRQSAKTTTIMAWLIGMCILMPGLQVAIGSGETGKALRLWFKLYVLDVLEGEYPDKETRPFTISRSAGEERIDWPNGSRLLIAGTEADFRGKTWDIIWCDEAQGLADERAKRWMGAARPTQNTRAGKVIDTPLLILSGTAGTQRTGNALWDALQVGRKGDEDTSILEFSAGIDLTIEDVETWEQTLPLLMACHPAVQPDNLTPPNLIRADFSQMSRPQFMAEYLSIFEDAGAEGALILPQKWQSAGTSEDFPRIPDDASLALAIGYHEAAASVCAAWRDRDGRAHIVVMKWDEGTVWLPHWVKSYTVKHPKAAFTYDGFRSAMRTEVDAIKRNTPRPRLLLAKTPDAADAANLFMRELNSGNLQHYGQAQLDAAASIVRRREIGKGFGFGLPDEGGDVSPLEAAALALRAYDAQPTRAGRGARFKAA